MIRREFLEYSSEALWLRFHNQLGIADRTAIECFDHGHTIHGKGTFDFLRKPLCLDR
jgi:hypothetical protein